MNPERVFISADHGLAIVYFLQSGVVPALLYEGVEVILLTDDALVGKINQRFGQPGLTVEGLRIKKATQYLEHVSPTTQWWLNFLRRVGASNKINVQALDSHIRQVEMEATGRRIAIISIMKLAISALRRSRFFRRKLVDLQMHYTPPQPGIYGDLFDQYQPSLVIPVRRRGELTVFY